MLLLKDRLFFCADTMVNIEPSAEELAEIAILAADTARFFDIEPRMAMLAFSSFGSVRHPLAQKWRARPNRAQAAAGADGGRRDASRDGRGRGDRRGKLPAFADPGDANVLIFPNLAAGNIGYKMLQRIGRAESIGPILMGMRHPVSVLPPAATMAEIVTATAISVVSASVPVTVEPAPVERELAIAK